MLVGIYGLGRFGAYWASQLARKFEVTAWSRNLDRPCPPEVRRVDEDEILSVDVLILCVAISAMEEVLERIAPRLKGGTLVMDTCSVKVHPAQAMMRILPEDVDILATHPMFGPDSGKNGLKGLPLVFSPLRMRGDSASRWRDNFRSLGLQVIDMTPDEHDREAAYTQGITHFIGRVLGCLNLSPSEIATAGYRGLLDIVTQTCNDPWKLFLDLQSYNHYTVQMRDELHGAIGGMMEQFNSIEAI